MSLYNTKIFVSPLTKDVYLCNVNTKNLITNRKKLEKDEMIDFIAGCVTGLENIYGDSFEFGDDKIKIEINIKHIKED